MLVLGDVVIKEDIFKGAPFISGHGFFRVDGGDYHTTTPVIALVMGILPGDALEGTLYLLLVDGVFVTEVCRHLNTWKRL